MARFDRSTWLRLARWGLAATLLLALARGAVAEERHALVVAIDGDDVLVDAGKPAGLLRGAPVQVFHLVIAKHPTTGKPVKAAFPIGGATVLEAGTALSLLSIGDPALRARLVVGDEVRFQPRTADEPGPGPQPGPGPGPGPGPAEPTDEPVPSPSPAGTGPVASADAEALETQARQALVNGQYAEALARAAAAVEKDPRRPQALQIAGVAACYVGRVDLAARYAARLVMARQTVVRQVCMRRGTPLPTTLAAGEVPSVGSATPGPGPAPAARPDPQLLEELAATFGAAAGQSQEQAYRVWQQYLERHPDSPFAPRVRQELAQRVAEAGGPTPALNTPARGYHHQPATRIEAGHPLAVAIAIGVDERPREVWLHHRRAGASTWQRRTLERDGDGYLRTTVPAAEVQAPGLEYFVEARTGDDAVSSVVADEAAPIEVEVTETVALTAPRRRGLSRVSALVEHVDFNSFGAAAPDRYTMIEVDFAYRFKGPVYAMRVGLGTLQGQGGALDAYGGADNTEDCPNREECRERTFTYAYSELEFRAQKNLSVSGRVYAGGLQKPRVGSSDEVRRSAFGFMGAVRIGEERGTNLSLGIANVNDFGTTGELKLQWGKVARLPLTGIVQATNLPSGEELGVRLAIEAGYKATSWFYPTLRISYNARTINHAGLGAGLAMVFDW
ncbi:MAG: hypothetical protein IT370_23490 [Deltaproteobacteria bacterium]|nr:hypothetical protein [Deltaproteobacteria bacterium]